MVMQTVLGSWDRTSSAGRNAASKLAQDISENDLAHSFMTFNTCYKVLVFYNHYNHITLLRCKEVNGGVLVVQDC